MCKSVFVWLRWFVYRVESLDGFPSHSEALSVLNYMVKWNPLFVARIPTGVSYECNLIWGYWLSGTGAIDRKNKERRVRYLTQQFVKDIKAEEEWWLKTRCQNHSESVNKLLHRMEQLDAPNDQHTSAEPTDSTDPINQHDGRMLLTALHHAREPSTLTATMYTFVYLASTLADWYRGRMPVVKGSNSHLMVPSLMLHRELLYVPFVNPDGYLAIQRSGIHEKYIPHTYTPLHFRKHRTSYIYKDFNIYLSTYYAIHVNTSVQTHQGINLSERTKGRRVQTLAESALNLF